MSISAPPGQPSITGIFARSCRDAAGVAKNNLVPIVLMIVAGTIAAYLFGTSGGFTPAGTPVNVPRSLFAFMAVLDLLIVIVAYYALAASVRTLNPHYRMSVGQFFGFIGYSLLAGLLTMIAALFFVIPGYWVGVKLELAPYTYIVTSGAPGTLKTTWNMTTGYYWQTFGFMLLLGFSLGVIAYAAFLPCVFVITRVPLSAIVLAPVGLAIVAWVAHAHALGVVRWTAELLPRASTPEGVAVPA